MTPKFRLRLKSIAFVSAVDTPAQPTTCDLVIKRDATGVDLRGTVHVVKVDELGVVLGWAFTSIDKGADFYDLQGDTIDEAEVVRCALEYAESGAQIDEMHDGEADAGKTVFLFPLTREVAKALRIDTQRTGLLIGIKPTPDVLAKFRDGTYTGWSIAGHAEREPIEKSATSGRPTMKAIDAAHAAHVEKQAGLEKAVEAAQDAFDDACAKFNVANGLPSGRINPFMRTEEGMQLASRCDAVRAAAYANERGIQ